MTISLIYNAPHRQYVITLSGRLEFETRSGAKQIVEPGDILLAEDASGGGHCWRGGGSAKGRASENGEKSAAREEGGHQGGMSRPASLLLYSGSQKD